MTDDSNTTFPDASKAGVILTDWSQLNWKGSKSEAKSTEEKTNSHASRSKKSRSSRFNPPKLSTSDRKKSRSTFDTKKSSKTFKARPAPSSTHNPPTIAKKRIGTKKKTERGISNKSSLQVQRKGSKGAPRSGRVSKNNSKTEEKGKKKSRGTKKTTTEKNLEEKQQMQHDEGWYRQGFERFDEDGDGKISFEDFAGAMNNIGQAHLTHRTLCIMFNKADTDRKGSIDFPAFLELLRNAEVFEKAQANDSSFRRRRKREKKA